MGKSNAFVFWVCVLSSLLLCGIFARDGLGQADGVNEVLIIDLEGPINQGTATYVSRGLQEAENRESHLAVIRLDTPGGLVSSMKTIVKAISNSSVPVIVYVAPSGAGAASAGVLITVAAHIAAMAPGTNIGAAHPVSSGGKDIGGHMSEKVVNDMASYGRSLAEVRGKNAQWVEKAIRESVSVTADEALKINVIDFVAKDMPELLRLVDGKEVTLNTGKITLKTSNIKETVFRQDIRDKVLKTISDPNIAYILMMIGLAGIYFELSHPGAVFPGVIGGISLILAFYSMQTLPVNYAGLLLIILAIIFFIAEIKVTSYGVLSIGGLISLIIGSMMLFGDEMGVSLGLLLPTTVLVGGFFAVVAGLAFKAYRSQPKTGAERLVGQVGVAQEPIDPEGMIFVRGEYWNARASERIDQGEHVAVESVRGLTLTVHRVAND